jgi:protein Hikeshi
MDAPESNNIGLGGGDITLGISLESAESVAAQIAALHQQAASTSTPNSSALVPINRGGGKTDTVVLAQRIIKNAFNFLASFSGNLDGGVEVVPLKAFEEWWRKFEGKVRSDPGFLERDGD